MCRCYIWHYMEGLLHAHCRILTLCSLNSYKTWYRTKQEKDPRCPRHCIAGMLRTHCKTFGINESRSNEPGTMSPLSMAPYGKRAAYHNYSLFSERISSLYANLLPNLTRNGSPLLTAPCVRCAVRARTAGPLLPKESLIYMQTSNRTNLEPCPRCYGTT